MMDLPSFGEAPHAVASAALIYKLLGPTADYLGGQTRDLAEIARNNLARIFQNASKKLGEEMDKPGSVPPRVLRGIVNDGAVCDDSVAADYLGGVLASSRGDGQRDDRGVVMNALISRLSVYQLRTHYIVYWIFKDLYQGKEIQWDLIQDRFYGISIPFMTYIVAMGFHENELKLFEMDDEELPLASILEHTFHGLHKEDLVGGFSYGIGAKDGIEITPSRTGMELFMWANGVGSRPTHEFLTVKFQPHAIEDVFIPKERIPIPNDENPEAEPVAYLEPYTFAVPEFHKKQPSGGPL